MPRAFTQPEMDLIRTRLLEKGREYFTRYGLKKTSVDELARSAGIAKGTFYRFFESKEALLMELHETSEGKLRIEMMSQLDKIKEPASKIRYLLKSAFAILEEDPVVVAVFGKGGLDGFTSFVHSREYEEHYHQNITFMIDLIRHWQGEGVVRQVDAEVAGNMIASVFFLYLQKETLGTELYMKVGDMLIESIVKYLAVE
ncbi:MAG: TetR/AcrR family transcriptional regulator [Dehalococcoidales bacterium]|nr:TetR/AcrR family transcriptional regulator [Dehalococcoidales bacterium]